MIPQQIVYDLSEKDWQPPTYPPEEELTSSLFPSEFVNAVREQATMSGWLSGAASPWCLCLPERLQTPIPPSSKNNSQIMKHTCELSSLLPRSWKLKSSSRLHLPLPAHGSLCQISPILISPVICCLKRQDPCLIRYPLRHGMLPCCNPLEPFWVSLSKHPPSKTLNLGGKATSSFPQRPFPLSLWPTFVNWWSVFWLFWVM